MSDIFLEKRQRCLFGEGTFPAKRRGGVFSEGTYPEKRQGRIFLRRVYSGKKQGRKMLRPYPTCECLGSIFVSRWTRAPGHVSFLDAHFQRSALRQRDNLLFKMGELFRTRLCDEITILDTYRAHLWDHKFRLEGDHHARLQRIF